MVTSPRIIFIVVCSLAGIVFLGLGEIFYLIMQKVDAALIGIIASPTSIALGALISLLNNTRTQAAPTSTLPDATAIQSTPVVVTNAPANPVNTKEN